MIRSIVVAGVRGGVGTTTVTALCAALAESAGARVSVSDHGGGTLAQRMATGPVTGLPALPSLSTRSFAPGSGHATPVDLLDAGRFLPAVLSLLDDPFTGLLLVSGTDAVSVEALAVARDAVAARPVLTERVQAMCVDVLRGRRRATPGTPPLVPHDRWLASGGPVDPARVGAPTVAALAAALDTLLRSRPGPTSG